MDHVLERIEIDLDIEFGEFYEEIKSGKYKKFKECPRYESVKALVDSSNALRKYLGWETISIRQMIQNYEINF